MFFKRKHTVCFDFIKETKKAISLEMHMNLEKSSYTEK